MYCIYILTKKTKHILKRCHLHWPMLVIVHLQSNNLFVSQSMLIAYYLVFTITISPIWSSFFAWKMIFFFFKCDFVHHSNDGFSFANAALLLDIIRGLHIISLGGSRWHSAVFWLFLHFWWQLMDFFTSPLLMAVGIFFFFSHSSPLMLWNTNADDGFFLSAYTVRGVFTVSIINSLRIDRRTIINEKHSRSVDLHKRFMHISFINSTLNP